MFDTKLPLLHPPPGEERDGVEDGPSVLSFEMLTNKTGDEASIEIEHWANQVVRSADGKVSVQVYYDGDSSTYVLRLMKGNRVLLFRLSEAQVQTAGREQECERTLKRKLKDLDNMI